MKQNYSVHVGLLWNGLHPSITKSIEFPSADFEDAEELCSAVASQLLEAISRKENFLISVNNDIDVMGA